MSVPSGSSEAGLQVERTALAWQRTALVLVLGAAVAGRAALPAVSPVVLVGGVTIALVGVLLMGAARARQARMRRGVEDENSRVDGCLPAAVVVLAVGCGVLSLAYWLVGDGVGLG